MANRKRRPPTAVDHVIAFIVCIVLIVVLNLALLAGAIWVVIKVLQATGVIS